MHKTAKDSLLFAAVVILAVTTASPDTLFAQEKRAGGVSGALPDSCWRTLESDHFLVHFTNDSEKLARHVAGIAEDVHERLSGDIDWDLSGRTHIVLLDWYDSMNGWSSPLPRNTIQIFPVGPGLSELELTFTDDWLRMVITHEYVHTLTLDMVAGLPAVFRKLLGRSVSTVPTAFMPAWVHEGYATYHESKHTAGGRVRGPYFDMILRIAVLEDRFNTLSQSQSGTDSWPMATQYVYGAMFCRYLADRYGEEKLFEIFRRQSSMFAPVVPWLPGLYETTLLSLYWLSVDPFGTNGFRIFSGVPYERLWFDWKRELERKYLGKKTELEKKGLTSTKRLTHTGYRTVEPRFSPDGSRIAYISRGGDRYTQLRIMDSDGSNDRLVCQGAVESLSWSSDGNRIVFSMLDYWRGLYFYSDLYICEVSTRSVKRLTKKMRARTPSWSPDGGKVLFATNTGCGNTDIAVLDLNNRGVTSLTNTDDLSFYSGCAWSPKGDKIAFVRLAPGKLQQIWVADSDGSSMRAITDGLTQDLTPTWSPDGKHILFASGRTGIYNIFAYNVETQQTVQLTNVLGGAISPSFSRDGKTVAFAGYSGGGWDIQTAEVDLDKAPQAQEPSSVLRRVEYPELGGDYRITDYRALRTILPTSWSPFFYYTGEYGAIVAGQDVLEKHFYTLQLGYSSFVHRPVMGLAYIYEGLKYRSLPVVATVRGYKVPVFYPELMKDIEGDYADYWEERAAFDFSLGVIIWRSTETEIRLSLGYEWMKFERISHLEPGGSVPGTGTLSSVYLSADLDSTKLYRMGISATDGRKLNITGKSAGPSLGSDYRIESLMLTWAEYVSSPWGSHHVMMGRVRGGASSGDIIDKRSLFQVGGAEEILPVSNSSAYPLRGYEANRYMGTHAAVATLEYRFPLRLIEGGPATRGLFLRKLSGYLFAESGNAWSGPMYLRAFKASAGLGLRLSTDLFYRRLEGYAIDLGFAHGFDRGGIDQVYFAVAMLW